jgi:hypothetical protein
VWSTSASLVVGAMANVRALVMMLAGRALCVADGEYDWMCWWLCSSSDGGKKAVQQ